MSIRGSTAVARWGPFVGEVAKRLGLRRRRGVPVMRSARQETLTILGCACPSSLGETTHGWKAAVMPSERPIVPVSMSDIAQRISASDKASNVT